VAVGGVHELNAWSLLTAEIIQRDCEEKEQSNVVVCGIDQMLIRKV